MKTLGISAFYHDAAAALVVDGEIIAAAQEERFTRKKHDPAFPANAIKFCLDYSGVTIDQLDGVAFYDKPLLKFERLLETYNAFAPKGLASFIAAMPVWLKEKMFLKRLIRKELEAIAPYDRRKLKLFFPEHHLSHAASAFYPSPYKDAAILTIDGVGEWATASICKGESNSITVLKELHFPHSLGLLYSAFTYYCGFKVNSGEYKLMGLAPYGNSGSDEVQKFKKIILEKLIELKEDGSLFMNQNYFNYATGLRMVDDKKWKNLFGFERRQTERSIEAHHCNLALAIQEITEDAVQKLAHEAKRIAGTENLCMAGGVALNCVANGKLLEAGIFKNIFVQPAAGDAGGAIGAALAVQHIGKGVNRRIHENTDGMKGAYLGPEYSALEIEKMARKFNGPYLHYHNFSELAERTAQLIAEGNVIGWFQHRMEFGPRALGARSILADPRNTEMQKTLNLKVKFREGFRPFAPSVLDKDASSSFEMDTTSPYMLMVHKVVRAKRKTLPDNYDKLTMMEKLYTERSELPAITHVDFSARVQTVHSETNPRYYELIEAFKKITGCGVIVNTSFNVRGEPLVCTPEDAYICFMRTSMDYLVVGNFIFAKSSQPAWNEKSNWQKEFELD